MYDSMRILAIIPARGGSKGIKNKNIINLKGHPLISYTIDAALKSKYIDTAVVSTDSEEIARISKACGASVPFLRPAELATDDSKTIDTVIHAINKLREMSSEFDVLVLLQPTQPLRDSKDIDAAIELFFDKGLKGLASVSLVDDNPLLMRTMNKDGSMTSLLGVNSTCRRQDMPVYYRVNGCIYINLVKDITESTSFNDNEIGYVMDKNHSVDIDELKDLIMAEYYLENVNINS